MDDVADNVCSTLISGYVSAELTTRRRRQVIAYLLVPYVVLQAVYVAVYVMLYWNESFRDHPGGKDRSNGRAWQMLLATS